MDRSRSIDAAAIVLLKVAISALVLRLGFSHVSDDDYARTVISERFAHAPALDPSGTSWLPFPFWMTGAAMTVVDRSLATASDVHIAASALASAFAYLSLRALPVNRWPALAGIVIAMALPWSAWLGAATVPEGFTAPLIVVGMATANARSTRTRWLGALALFAASLSRYEAWPVCAVFFLTGVEPGLSFERVLAHFAALAGPAGWMAWNLHAHGSATHFLDRVAAYRSAIGAGDDALSTQLAVYPRALLELGAAPIFLGFCALVVFCIRRDFRVRWMHSFACAASMLGFLIYGETRGGAPTHHPERALLAVAWLLVTAGVDAAIVFTSNVPKKAAAVGGAAAVAAWLGYSIAAYGASPGRSADEDRAPQIARGLDLRARNVAHLTIAPCAYEHFALLAAFGAPERADVAAVSPHDAVTRRPAADCPRVEER